jgi:hypothetical protein
MWEEAQLAAIYSCMLFYIHYAVINTFLMASFCERGDETSDSVNVGNLFTIE